MTTEYEELDINLLDEHPDNPRIIYRDDVINSVAHEIKLNGKEVLANDNALSVAPRNGRYIIYKGHHRYKGAKKENLDTIYCWVNNDVTDEEMYNELLLDNNQAELTPLERGKHAFVYTEKYNRDGKSVSKYAERIGEGRTTIENNKVAYEVYNYCKKCDTQVSLLKLTAKHYRLIHSLNKKEWWPWIAKKAIDSELKWSSIEIEKKIKGLKEIIDIPEVFNDWLKVEDIKEEVIKDPDLGEKYKRLSTMAKDIYDNLKEKVILYDIIDEYEENEKSNESIYHPKSEFLEKLKGEQSFKQKDVHRLYSEILKFIDEKEEKYQEYLKRINDKKEREKQERERNQKKSQLLQRYEPEFYNQDCLSMTNEQVADNSVDLILTDPPYGLSDGTFTLHGGKEVSVVKGEWDKKENLSPLKDWIDLCSQKLKPGGNLFICSTFHNLFEVGYEIQKHKDLKLIQYIGWQSKNPAPIFTDDRFGYIFEIVIFARKNGKVNYFDRDAIADTQGRKQVGNYWILDTVPHGKERIHPTQKPEELGDRIIKCACHEDGLVLDIFSGGGTFLVSAKKNLRRSIGFEKDEKIYKQAVNRIEKIEITIEDEKIKFDNNKQSKNKTKKIDKIDNYI